MHGDQVTGGLPGRSDRKQEVWVFYALGYYEDHGNNTGHPGDSEFIVASVVPAGGTDETQWRLSIVCLSAHWRAPILKPYSACYDVGSRAHVEVWVAYEKHANYGSQELCDHGAGGWDTCENHNHGSWEAVEVLENGKIGSRDPSRQYFGRVDASAVEKLWSNQKFCGWQSVGDRSRCASSYRKMLEAFRFDVQAR